MATRAPGPRTTAFYARAPDGLEQFAREVGLSLQPIARVTIECGGSSDELQLDRARVHQVLVNLVDDAVKHARTRVDVGSASPTGPSAAPRTKDPTASSRADYGCQRTRSALERFDVALVQNAAALRYQTW